MDYDLAVIGAGWAGFNAALKAKELGLKTALIERDKLGGTCLNRGCIPTKALIQSAKILSLCKKSTSFGIECGTPLPDFVRIQERKARIVAALSSGMQSRLKGIDFIQSPASFVSPGVLKLDGRSITSRSVLIATGSRPVELPFLKFDGTKVISSDDALNLEKIPDSILIVGGGVIGCEFAGLFATLGAKVVIVEKMPQLLPGEDREVARKLESVFKKKGIKLNLAADAASFDPGQFERVLVCVGRSPASLELGLENIGIKAEKEKVSVDKFTATGVAGVFAAGDCTGGVMLAHYAAYQAKVAAGNIADPAKRMPADNAVIPGCIFTDPEVARVGLTEEAAASKGEVRIYRFDFLGSGMARIQDEADGFIKIVADAKSDALLGATIIGPRATELIAIFGLALTNGLKADALRKTVFAHPSFSEAIAEAL